MSSHFEVSEYSEKSVVLRGDLTKKYKDRFIELYGKWNKNLKGGAGWIFSKKREDKLIVLIKEIECKEKNIEVNQDEKKNIKIPTEALINIEVTQDEKKNIKIPTEALINTKEWLYV